MDVYLEKTDLETSRLKEQCDLTIRYLKNDEKLKSYFNLIRPEVADRKNALRPDIINAINSINSNSNNPHPVRIHDIDFRIERLEVFPEESMILDRFTYCAFATGPESYMDPQWSREMAIRYHKCYKIFADLANIGIMPITMTIVPPYDPSNESWVDSFGPSIIFLFHKGVEFLTRREEGNTYHEAFHLVMSLYQQVYSKIIEPNPYLNESLAILSTLMFGNKDYAIKSPHQKTSKFDQINDGLNTGNEISYTHQLLANLTEKMPSFDELNGGQLFKEIDYPKRMLLSTFLYTLLRARNETEKTESTPQMIARGIKSLIFLRPNTNYSSDQEINASIVRNIFSVFNQVNTLDENKITEDLLLNKLFGVNKKKLEKDFQKYGLANYLLQRISHAFKPEEVWSNLNQEITKKYAWIGKIAVNLKRSRFSDENKDEVKKFMKNIVDNLKK